MKSRRRQILGIGFAAGLVAVTLAWILRIPPSTVFRSNTNNDPWWYWSRDAKGAFSFAKTRPAQYDGTVTYSGRVSNSGIFGYEFMTSAYVEVHHHSLQLDRRTVWPPQQSSPQDDAPDREVRAAYLNYIAEQNPSLDRATADRIRSSEDTPGTRYLLPRGVASLTLQIIGMTIWVVIVLYLFFWMLGSWLRWIIQSKGALGVCCARCKYDLSGFPLSETPNCPECGLTLPRSTAAHARK